jgi:beta-mannosidase
MVPQQQLRWHRTTLLGRTPGWSPSVAPVGPVGAVWCERRNTLLPLKAHLHSTVDADGRGHVRAVCDLTAAAAAQVERIELEVRLGGQAWRVRLSPQGGRCEGTLTLEQPVLWWPHTHGEPVLYEATLITYRRDLEQPTIQALRPFGFRRIEADTEGGRFSLKVNGVPVFCRGACWTPLDVVTLQASPEALHAAVQQARDAGMNMLRVGGTMVYEGDAFFDACDALGMLVWQEFMFANMDYPEHDSTFLDSVRAEVAQQTARWQGRACVVVVCGNSEMAQQAAMWGAPRELWAPELFHTVLRQSVEAALPGLPYWPSSAWGGAFPHQANAGTASYYGVGAYLRPLDDARRADLSFATECLAFANVPDERTLVRMPGGEGLRVHHPDWKARTPRDLNAGWDFEDVRDHYLASWWGVDPERLRRVDHERYLALSRVVTGEVMVSAFTEWRRPGSRCGGALVWFLRDLWAGG